MEALAKKGLSYLINHGPVGELDAVMFDIDDTLIFTSGVINTPILKLLWDAQAMGFLIVIITARPGSQPVIQFTLQQLERNGIAFNKLAFADAYMKGKVKRDLGYNFVLSVGDQPTDFTDSRHYINTSNFSHS
jgi:predicted HAD superfamily phosphohydrolase YqeG